MALGGVALLPPWLRHRFRGHAANPVPLASQASCWLLGVTLPVSAEYLFGDLILGCGCPAELSQHLCRCQGSGMTNCSSSAKDESKDAVVRTTSSAGGQAKL